MGEVQPEQNSELSIERSARIARVLDQLSDVEQDSLSCQLNTTRQARLNRVILAKKYVVAEGLSYALWSGFVSLTVLWGLATIGALIVVWQQGIGAALSLFLPALIASMFLASYCGAIVMITTRQRLRKLVRDGVDPYTTARMRKIYLEVDAHEAHITCLPAISSLKNFRLLESNDIDCTIKLRFEPILIARSKIIGIEFQAQGNGRCAAIIVSRIQSAVYNLPDKEMDAIEKVIRESVNTHHLLNAN